MKDKFGNEIQVGDTVKFHYYDGSYKLGIISEVKLNAYCVNTWSNEWYGMSEYIEVIIPAKQEQPAKSLSELKRQAQQAILELIQKHTTAINSAGGNFSVNVSMYDAKILGNGEPKQLVDVNVTVTI